MIEFLTSPVVTTWVAKRLDATADDSYFKNSTAIGILRDGKPVAGVVYSQFRELPSGNDIMLSIATEPKSGWATARSLRVIHRYPFVQLGCTRATVLVAEGNTESLDLVKRLGYRKEGIVRRGWNGKTNAILFGMLKEECRFL